MTRKDVVCASLDSSWNHLQCNQQHATKALFGRRSTILLGGGKSGDGEGEGTVDTQDTDDPKETTQDNGSCGPIGADDTHTDEGEDEGSQDKGIGGSNILLSGKDVESTVSKEDLGVAGLNPAMVGELVAKGHAKTDDGKEDERSGETTEFRVDETIPQAPFGILF